ncbi:MAG: phosphoribosyl-AMP cyclohydrolase [Phycisphaerae bacterium]|nr:phosphoribosyl-AMP cyclohydrolase [Phycisphaerae bacterium]
MSAPKEVEVGSKFTPKYDSDGLIPAIAQDAASGEVLMVAYMNEVALAETIKTGNAIYYSRSRQKLWRKGEESGHVQKVKDILVDCDQDCLILKVEVDSGQCHVGYQSCFYRRVKPDSAHEMEFISSPVYDPNDVYKK